MRGRSRHFAILFGTLALGAWAPLGAADLWIYQNSLENGFADWSWATRNLAATGAVHSAPNAIEWQPDDWEGLFFHRDAVFASTDYLELRFWVYGVGAGGQQVRIALQAAGDELLSADLDAFVNGGAIVSNAWREVVLPLSLLGAGGAELNELILQDDSGGNQAAVRVDDLRFTENPNPPPPPAVTVSVDPALDRRAISDLVYGANFANEQQLADVGYTVNRWGGNRKTRYNWQLDVDNSANDWYFINYAGDGVEAQLPATSDADRFLLANRAARAESVLTLPTIGRVAGPDRERHWGFSVGDYGPQLATECSEPGSEEWCQPDAGNGTCANGSGPNCVNGLIVNTDPDDTTVVVQPSFLGAWVDFAGTRVGSADQGGLRFVALDNEPMLWNSTHRDIHPAAPTYAEVWTKGLAVALAAKSADPKVQVLGPDTWGWCDLWTSAADAAGDCTDGPDRQAHGGTPFVAWYLQQSCAYQQQHGTRPIDYVDVHYYPQSGEAFGGDGYGTVRLQSIRELWDPTYVSQSWIGDEVFLIPRLRAWVDSYCPGTRIAITEYSWGADGAGTGALAQAEVLAIFGREGADLATRWGVPASGSKTEEAFRLFLSYDGAGSNLFGDRVRALSSVPATVGAYAIRGHEDQLFVLLFNKAASEREATITIAGALAAGGFDLWRFTASTPLAAAGHVAAPGGVITLTLPARSATLAVGRVASNLVFADRFETSTALGWSAIVP